MKTADHERRDRSLLMFIVPIGILLMFIVGHFAIRMLPRWSLNVGMQSNLNPETSSVGPISLFQPILPQILTPMDWLYLTPGDNVIFPPFITIEPGASRTPTPVFPTPTFPPSINTASTTPIPPSSTNTLFPTFPIPTRTLTPTSIHPVNTPTQAFTATVTLTFTSHPTTTATTTATATTTTTATTTAEVIISPTPTGFPSTPPGNITPPPPGFQIGPPDGISVGIPQGTFMVIDLNQWGVAPIIVNGPWEMNYDLVYYEMQFETSGTIFLDNVIIGISNYSDGSIYYEVFNWGDGILDLNSNVGNISGVIEVDNAIIQMSDLYAENGIQTGILIDVDNAPSYPPPGEYRYVVIVSPIKPLPAPPTETIEVDSINLLEVPR